MMDSPAEYRSFRGGSWDLRKLERRKEQMTIVFPDRRKQDRRGVGQAVLDPTDESLQWIDPSGLDE